MTTSVNIYLRCICMLAIVGSAVCHSWIACADYLEMNGDYWEKNKCRGYPRFGEGYSVKDFGSDQGYNHQPAQSNGELCKGIRSSGDVDYSVDYPHAVYYLGQVVVLTHPSKNHCAETCTNKYIPDNGNYLWRGPKDPSSDPTLSDVLANQVFDFGVSPFGYEMTTEDITTYPKPGFQNVPKFCENTDRAMGTYNFTVPTDLEPGTYTFVWGWYFNSPNYNDLYTTCFDVEVFATRSERDAILINRGMTTEDPEGIPGQTTTTASASTTPSTSPTPSTTPSPSPTPSSSTTLSPSTTPSPSATPSPSPTPSPSTTTPYSTPSPSPSPSPIPSCTCQCGYLGGCGAVTLNQPSC